MHAEHRGNNTAEEVEKILALKKLVESYQTCIAQLEDNLTSDGNVNMVDHNMQLAKAQSSLDKVTHSLWHQENCGAFQSQ
ncbi:hypothetical protein PAXRUDRAFT_149112 [Paxillus rubicundulus Ve08.2h10]|uniref:Uncharacterized protein n=1 Tax=Paxillus rubicundulus Ve08.2h10 TaxID=930991 RepID=A0A0D0DYD9_9AGAM|nr:hypothetical protein PAXRUDRAFT_149112 [Paxillus rubicundulus Ve08.2h10]